MQIAAGRRCLPLALLLASCAPAPQTTAGAPAPAGPLAGGSDDPADAQPWEPPANLQHTDCRFAVPTSLEGQRYVCYDLLVPENRSVAASRTISVHTIVFRGKPGGTPTIELNGGPGGPSEMLAVDLALGDTSFIGDYHRFLEQGDLVLVDQRGIGRSLPRLSCNPDEMSGSMTQQAQRCAARFIAQGVDLTGYVTSENADDIHDLKVALGAPQANLHAISYGTRLALEVLRRHPDDVAAVIIDGVMPAQVKFLSEGDRNIDLLLTRIFSACAADAKCNAHYPGLDRALSQLATQLDRTPLSFEGQPYDWYAFLGEVLNNLYADGFAGELPRRIYQLLHMTQSAFEAEMEALIADEERGYQQWQGRLESTALGREALERMAQDPDPMAAEMADGMYLSVICSDFVPYESLDEALALEAKVRPELRSDEFLRDIFAACQAWPSRPRTSGVFEAVVSDRPVLAVAGRYDPATPAAWRDLAAETLSASQKLTMQAGAHGAMDRCAMGVKLAFVADPSAAIDGACAASRGLEFAYDDSPLELRAKIDLRSLASRRPPTTAALAPLALGLRAIERARPQAARRWRATRPNTSAIRAYLGPRITSGGFHKAPSSRRARSSRLHPTTSSLRSASPETTALRRARLFWD